MKINFENCGDNVIFRIHDFDQKYEDVLKMCFYQKDSNSYIKSFPKNIKSLEKIKAYYLNNAEKMFSQLGYFSHVPWEAALYEFISKIAGSGIDWWLVGSCATCIRGIKMNPHDVDIFIDSKDVDKLNELFKDYIIEPIINTNGWLTKDFGVLFLHARIDIATDPHPCLDNPEPVDCGPYARNNLEEVTWKGYKIKVPPVELQLNVNKKRGRYDRVKLIENYLQNN